MHLDSSILTLITFLPTAGALMLLLLPRQGRAIQWGALFVTLATFVISLHLVAHYVVGQAGFQFEQNVSWIPTPAIRYHLGIDGLSLWLVLLTTFLAPLGVLVSWRAIETRTKEFYVLFLLQQTAMLGVFVSLDLFLYYAFWEMTLVPMTLIIGMYGIERGRQAAIKFFLYTFIPSALLLVGILWLYAKTGTFDFVELQTRMPGIAATTPEVALLLASLAFLLAFAVKVPVFPLHGWLSDGLREAPAALAMVLAGKLGLYSLLRFHVELFPVQAARVAPWMIALAVIGVLYGALLALVQTDIKRVAAYATLSGVSFAVLGIYSFATNGINGAVFQTLNEGVTGGALFMLIGMLYERYRTYDIAAYGGLAARMPWLASLFVVTGLSFIGLPLLNGFVGEFLILSGTFTTHQKWAVAATFGVILSAAYMLWLIQRIFYGPQKAIAPQFDFGDLNSREKAALWPAIFFMLWMGVASPLWLRVIESVPQAVTASLEAKTSKLPAVNIYVDRNVSGVKK